MNQKTIVYNFMVNRGSITTMQAFWLGITRLASRIHELRKDGFQIEGETVVRLNRHGRTVRFTKYRLVNAK